VLRIRHGAGAPAQRSPASGWRIVHSRSSAATNGSRSDRRTGRPSGSGRRSMRSRMPSRRSATSKSPRSQAKWNAITMRSDSRRCFRFGPRGGGSLQPRRVHWDGATPGVPARDRRPLPRRRGARLHAISHPGCERSEPRRAGLTADPCRLTPGRQGRAANLGTFRFCRWCWLFVMVGAVNHPSPLGMVERSRPWERVDPPDYPARSHPFPGAG
jgi:hypothetical protein